MMAKSYYYTIICTQYCFFWCPPQWLPTDWIKLLKHNITSGDELCLPMCVYGRARGVVDSYTWFLIYAIPYTSFRMSLINWWVIFKFLRICQRNCINCNHLNDMYKMSNFFFSNHTSYTSTLIFSSKFIQIRQWQRTNLR